MGTSMTVRRWLPLTLLAIIAVGCMLTIDAEPIPTRSPIGYTSPILPESGTVIYLPTIYHIERWQ